MTKLTLIRGVPGSGKSTLAKSFQSRLFEADQFFLDQFSPPNYNFDPHLLEAAHALCFGKTAEALRRGEDTVVANTFTKDWEVEKYLRLAQIMNVPTTVIHCLDEFENVHGCPQEKIDQMKARFWSNDNLFVKYCDEFPNVKYSTYRSKNEKTIR